MELFSSLWEKTRLGPPGEGKPGGIGRRIQSSKIAVQLEGIQWLLALQGRRQAELVALAIVEGLQADKTALMTHSRKASAH